jgi:hypothetical protein
MNFGKAMAIFIQIDSDKYSDIEKALAIYYVMKAPTHMSIKKDYMLNVIKWLWNNLYEIQVDDTENATTTEKRDNNAENI